MTAVWIVLAAVALLYLVSRGTAMPAARGVPVSVRFAEARALVARPAAASSTPHAPHPVHRTASANQSSATPRHRVAYRGGRADLRRAYRP